MKGNDSKVANRVPNHGLSTQSGIKGGLFFEYDVFRPFLPLPIPHSFHMKKHQRR